MNGCGSVHGFHFDDLVLAMQVQRYPVIHVLRENIKMKKAKASARDVALATWLLDMEIPSQYTGTNPIKLSNLPCLALGGWHANKVHRSGGEGGSHQKIVGESFPKMLLNKASGTIDIDRFDSI